MLKCEAISKKFILKKYPISRVYTSKRSIAYYTNGIMTFVTLPLCKFILKKVWTDFSFKILAHCFMAVTLSRPFALGKVENKILFCFNHSNVKDMISSWYNLNIFLIIFTRATYLYNQNRKMSIFGSFLAFW